MGIVSICMASSFHDVHICTTSDATVKVTTECINSHRDALEPCAASHLNQSSSRDNLAVAFSSRFDQKGDISDSEECIGCHKQAVEKFETLTNYSSNALLDQQQSPPIDCVVLHEDQSVKIDVE